MSMGNRMPDAGGWFWVIVVGCSLMLLLMEVGSIYGTN